MKYNEKISDYNSDEQKYKDIQQIGNIIFNKIGNRKDQEAWLRYKEYVKRLEKQIEE